MDNVRLGKSGLQVGRIGLGCMSYGRAATGLHQWTLDEDAAAAFFRQAIELGITFWDTANVYQDGTSEEFVGRAIQQYSRREDIVLATKVSGKMHDGPVASLARPSWSNWRTRCADSVPITSTSTTSIASTSRCRSRKRWRRCTTS